LDSGEWRHPRGLRPRQSCPGSVLRGARRHSGAVRPGSVVPRRRATPRPAEGLRAFEAGGRRSPSQQPYRGRCEACRKGAARPRAFERVRGERVAVLAKSRLETGGKRVEGELLGRDEDTGSVRLQTDGAGELSIHSDEIKRIQLVYRWGGDEKARGPASMPKGE